jgi:serine protease Do
MGEQLAAFFKLSEKKGILVTSVDADGPAAKAGMKAGDVILKFDGDSIRDAEDLRDAVSDAEGGQEVTVTVQRDGRAVDLKVTPAKPESRRIRPSGVTL